MLLIEAAQNADGGWPYHPGKSSWTEPTVFALLSGLANEMDPGRVRRGIAWLKASQNHDGGWSPQPGVGPSTWVGALVALLPSEKMGEESHRACLQWLLEQTGQESSVVHRIRQWMLGNQELSQGAERGWPWFPGAAAWVMPTAISLIALRKEQKARPEDRFRERIEAGTQFLMTHACAEGGWNHGSTHALGYEAKAYPETTGVALLALRGVKQNATIEKGIMVAENFLKEPSPASVPWLQLGLIAQNRVVPQIAGSTRELQLDVVNEALATLSKKSNALLT